MVFVTNNAAKVQLLFELLSTTRFFRGKLSVRCYPPASVPRVAVAWRSVPRLRFTFRFARLGLLRLCAAGTRGQYSDIPIRTPAVRPYNPRHGASHQ